jgi:DNA-binding protein YbaB
MSLKQLEYELYGLIEIKEQLLDEDDESLDDEIDEAIGRVLSAMEMCNGNGISNRSSSYIKVQ